MSFALHPQLAADTIYITDLKLCRVLLMNNANFPWLILVPMRDNISEIFQLAPDDYALAMSEVRSVTEKFAAFTKADKMNVATLGNMVPQLHIHIIARYKKDGAWPGPVWNTLPPLAYSKEKSEVLVKELAAGLTLST